MGRVRRHSTPADSLLDEGSQGTQKQLLPLTAGYSVTLRGENIAR